MSALRIRAAALCMLATVLVMPPCSMADEGTVTEVQVQSLPVPDPAGEYIAPDPGELPELLAEAAEVHVLGPGEGLSLQEALQRAIAAHPGIAVLRMEQQALDSLAWQEGRKPNPELEIELEEFGGTEEASGFSSMASSITYSQALERGGKRGLREMTARLEAGLLAWDIAELEHEIQSGVRLAYAEAQAARYEQEQLQRYRELVQHIYDTVAASVEAGRSARLELERLDIELARIDLQISAAERSISQAYQALAASMGQTEPDFVSVEIADPTRELEDLAELLLQLDEHPAVARHAAEYDALNALLELENANRISDLELFGGISRLNEINETVFKVGVAWELPVHDRNEGNVNAAYHRREQVELSRSAARLGLETELATLYSQALHALQNYEEYGSRLLPAANEALALTEEGYRYGKFELLDVLDAQRTVLELESEQTAAMVEYTLALAGIEALLNTDLGSWASVAREAGAAPLEIAGAGFGAIDATEDHDNETE